MHALILSLLLASTLPTGSAYVASTGGTCGGALTTSSCRLATVTCKSLWDPEASRSFSIDDLTASLKVTRPAGTPVGTLITQQGGGGSGAAEANTFGATWLQALVDAGWIVIQQMWASNGGNGMWFGSSSSSSYGGDGAPDGPLDLACRYATLSRAICADTALHVAGTPCVAHGQSGGSSAVTYALTRYGAGDWLDGVLLSGGPPIGDLERGCTGSTYPSWVATTCPSLRATGAGLCVYVNGPTSGQFVDGAWNDGRVGCANQSAANTLGPQGLGYSSALGGQARLRHPYTWIRALYGDLDGSEAVPLGRVVVQRLVDATGSTPVNVVTTGASAPHAILDAAGGATALTTMVLGGTYLGVTYPAITRVRPDVSAQFAPHDLAGLELWVTAESTAHLWQEATTQPLTHATASSDPIGTLDDMSPAAHALVAPSLGTRPTLAAGGLAFASSALVVANSLDAFRPIYWSGVGGIVARLAFANDNVAGTLVDSNGASTSASGFLVERTSANKIRVQVTKGSAPAVFDYTTTVSALAADGEQTLAIVFGNAGGGTVRWGGSVEAFTRTSAPTGTGQAAAALAIGRRADGTNALAATVRHLAIFSRAPTEVEIAQLGAWAPTRSSAPLVSWRGVDGGYWSGLSHWYDLTDATTTYADTAGTTAITAAAGVALVRPGHDRSGRLGRDLTQSTSANRPTWSSGGQAGVGAVFDGVNDALSLTANWPAAGAQTLLAVVRQDDTTFGGPLLGGTLGSDNYTWLGAASYPSWTVYPTGDTPTEMVVPMLHSGAGSWSVLEVVRDGSSWNLRSVGGSTASYTDSTAWVQRSLGSYSTYRLHGAVRAVLLWHVALTAEQLARVRQHLCGRFSGAC